MIRTTEHFVPAMANISPEALIVGGFFIAAAVTGVAWLFARDHDPRLRGLTREQRRDMLNLRHAHPKIRERPSDDDFSEFQ